MHENTRAMRFRMLGTTHLSPLPGIVRRKLANTARAARKARLDALNAGTATINGRPPTPAEAQAMRASLSRDLVPTGAPGSRPAKHIVAHMADHRREQRHARNLRLAARGAFDSDVFGADPVMAVVGKSGREFHVVG